MLDLYWYIKRYWELPSLLATSCSCRFFYNYISMPILLVHLDAYSTCLNFYFPLVLIDLNCLIVFLNVAKLSQALYDFILSVLSTE